MLLMTLRKKIEEYIFSQNQTIDMPALKNYCQDSLKINPSPSLKKHETLYIVLALYQIALDIVSQYIETRIISAIPLKDFYIVQKKLGTAKNLSCLIDTLLKKLTTQSSKQEIDVIYCLYQQELLSNMDTLINLMGARGFMLDYKIAKIWEVIYEEILST